MALEVGAALRQRGVACAAAADIALLAAPLRALQSATRDERVARAADAVDAALAALLDAQA